MKTTLFALLLAALFLAGCGNDSVTQIRDGKCWCGTVQAPCNSRCE